MTALELEQNAEQIVAAYNDKELDKPFTLVGAFDVLNVPIENQLYLKERIKHKQEERRQARKKKEEEIKERDREWWDNFEREQKSGSLSAAPSSTSDVPDNVQESQGVAQVADSRGELR